LIVRAIRTRKFFKIEVSFKSLAFPFVSCVMMAMLLAIDSLAALAALFVASIVLFIFVNRDYVSRGLAMVKRKMNG